MAQSPGSVTALVVNDLRRMQTLTASTKCVTYIACHTLPQNHFMSYYDTLHSINSVRVLIIIIIV